MENGAVFYHTIMKNQFNPLVNSFSKEFSSGSEELSDKNSKNKKGQQRNID